MSHCDRKAKKNVRICFCCICRADIWKSIVQPLCLTAPAAVKWNMARSNNVNMISPSDMQYYNNRANINRKRIELQQQEESASSKMKRYWDIRMCSLSSVLLLLTFFHFTACFYVLWQQLTHWFHLFKQLCQSCIWLDLILTHTIQQLDYKHRSPSNSTFKCNTEEITGDEERD